MTQDVATNIFSYDAEQKAYYVEDKWQVTDRWLLILGLRGDKFTNFTPFGQAYVDTDLQLAPRLGFNWDVHGDSSLKVYGNWAATTLACRCRRSACSSADADHHVFHLQGHQRRRHADHFPATGIRDIGQLALRPTRRRAYRRGQGSRGREPGRNHLGFTKQLDSGWVAGVRATAGA